MRELTEVAHVLLGGFELVGSVVGWWLALVGCDGVRRLVCSLLDLGLGRRPSRREWHSARPGRSRVLWLLVGRLPCLVDVMFTGWCFVLDLSQSRGRGRLYPTNRCIADVAGSFHTCAHLMQACSCHSGLTWSSSCPIVSWCFLNTVFEGARIQIYQSYSPVDSSTFTY